MAKINTLNYQTVASWNDSQDLFVVEQPDGTKVATPEQVKQYVLGNSIDDIYSVIGDLSQTGLTGDSVAAQLSGVIAKAEKNPSVFSDYTSQGLYAGAQPMTITNLQGGYKVKDGICYVNMQISFTGTFSTPGAWNFIDGFPASAIDGIPIMAVPTNNDTNTVALRGGRINTTGNLYIINESRLTGENSTAFTFIGSYPVANS